MSQQNRFVQETTPYSKSLIADSFFGNVGVKKRNVSTAMMPFLASAVANTPLPPEAPALLHRRDRQIALATQRYNLPVRSLGLSPIFEETRIYGGVGATSWVLSPLHNDPAYHHFGNGLAVTPEAKRQINRIKTAGIDVTALYLAHEIPTYVVQRLRPGESVPLEWLLPSVPKHVQHRLQKLARTNANIRNVAESVVKAGAIAAATLSVSAAIAGFAVVGGAAALTGGALALTAGLVLDPVLIGVSYERSWQYKGQPIGAWYYLCDWVYPHE